MNLLQRMIYLLVLIILISCNEETDKNQETTQISNNDDIQIETITDDSNYTVNTNEPKSLIISLDDLSIYNRKIDDSNFSKMAIKNADSTKLKYHEILDDKLLYVHKDNSYITFHDGKFYDFKIEDKNVITFKNYNFEIGNYIETNTITSNLYVETMFIQGWDNSIEMVIRNDTIIRFDFFIPT